MEINVLRLIDECITSQLCENNENEPVVNYRNTESYPSSMPYGAWISNNGTIHFIISDKHSGHYESASDILDQLDRFPKPSKTDPDYPDHEDAYNDNVYDTIFRLGYIRLVHDRMNDGKSIYMAENGIDYGTSSRHALSLAQKSALRNISIQYKKHVYFNGRAIGGYNPDLLDESITQQLRENWKSTSWTDVVDGEDVTVTIEEMLSFIKKKKIPIRKIKTAILEPYALHKTKTDKQTIKKVLKSNLKYPIIVLHYTNIYQILDGHHRLQKAINTKIPTIKAIVVELTTLPKKWRKILKNSK